MLSMKYYSIQLNKPFVFEYMGHQKAPWGEIQFLGYINGNRSELRGLPSLQKLNHELMSCKYKKGVRVEITRLSQGRKGQEEAKFKFKILDSQLRF